MRRSSVRSGILFIFHAAVFVGGYLFAWAVRFEFSIPTAEMPGIRMSLPIVVATQLLAGVAFGFYKGWWRYVGISDVVRLVAGLTSAQIVLVLLWYAGGRLGFREALGGASRGALLIDWAFVLLMLFGARVAIRLGRDRASGRDRQIETRRVLIVGAGDAGETLAREIEHRPSLGMKVVGFVDDDRGKWRSHIRGVEVLGPIARIEEIADSKRATEALIAIPSADGRRLREIVRSVADAQLHFRTIPGIDRIVSGQVDLTQLRPVSADDLLRRERIELPGNPVQEMFRGRRVLVTGAGGSIGSELVVQILAAEPALVVLVERSEYAMYEVRRRVSREAAALAARVEAHLVDVGDRRAIETVLSSQRPEIVLHAAAHKHVPIGEENPAEYLENNCLKASRFAELCARHGIERFVFVSTDKAINPTSVMGATKRAAEILLIDLARRVDMNVTIVRFGNVIGSSGSVVPLFLEQIAAGGPVTVTHPEVTRYFLRTSEAVSLVLQAATLGQSGRVYMLDMGEPVKVVDLARDLIRLSERSEADVPIVFTGLRPGEKLFEEIRLDGEFTHPTMHPHIVVTEAPQPEHDVVDAWIARADDGARTSPVDAIELLADLVEEYDTPRAPVAPRDAERAR